MQCVILCAGEGVRMRPLTLEKPKPLLEVCGKPILAHIIEALPEVIDEVILVVGYKGEMIRNYFADSFAGRQIRYVTQENPKAGTADAFFKTAPLVTGKCLVMYGDDIHGKDSLKEVCAREHGMLTARSESPERFGVLVIREDGTLERIVEKPADPPSNFVNIGGFVLTPDIFSFTAPLSAQNEYYLTDSVTAYAAKYPVTVIEQTTWIPIGYPDDIEKAETILCPDH